MFSTVIYSISVTLCSDMCCGTGGGDGSYVNTLATTDVYGLPALPAKRLRGLLRECGNFLECGTKYSDRGLVKFLFGDLYKPGCLSVSDGYLKDREKIVAALAALPKREAQIASPDAVRSAYTVLRSQTVSKSDGFAKRKSLRTMESIAKGNVFVFEVRLHLHDLDEMNSQDIQSFLEACITSLRCVGMSKTRGFGEVACSILSKETTILSKHDSKQILTDTRTPRVTVPFTITLGQDEFLSKNDLYTIDYFPGSMVQAAFARFITGEDEHYKALILNEVEFSNAYPVVNGCRCIPAPYTLCNESAVEIVKQKVEIKNSFHNAPLEKQPFRLKCIQAGQTFKGSITASESGVAVLRAKLEVCGGSLEFDVPSFPQLFLCAFSIDNQLMKSKTLKTTSKIQSYVVECLSDIVLMNNYGSNSTDPAVLLSKLTQWFSFDTEKIDLHLKTIIIGSYKTDCRLPQRHFYAFRKGSVIVLNEALLKEHINCIQRVGLFTNEGFGELRIRERYSHKTSAVIPKECDSECDKLVALDVLEPVFLRYASDYLIAKACMHARENALKETDISQSAAMRLMKPYGRIYDIIDNGITDKASSEIPDRYCFTDNSIEQSLIESLNSGFSIGLKDLAREHPGIVYNVAERNINQLFRDYARAWNNQMKREFKPAQLQTSHS